MAFALPPRLSCKSTNISRDEVPYISLTDLIVFKLDSSGLRSNPIKKERDAQDAAALVDFATHKSSLHLSEKQEQVVEEALCDVAKCGTKEKGWWERRMGLIKQAADGSPYDSGGRERKPNRPHSKSDPSPSKSPLTNDPNAAWHYEAGSRTHPAGHGLHHDTAEDDTTASYQLGVRRSGLSSEINAEPNCYGNVGEQYYTLEPGENMSGRASPAGYFDVSRTPPGGLGTVTEHTVGFDEALSRDTSILPLELYLAPCARSLFMTTSACWFRSRRRTCIATPPDAGSEFDEVRTSSDGPAADELEVGLPKDDDNENTGMLQMSAAEYTIAGLRREVREGQRRRQWSEYELKSKLINKAIQDIGMGRYNWQLFVLCGFGWFADNLWMQGVSLTLPSLSEEFGVSEKQVRYTTSSLFAGLCLGSFLLGARIRHNG
ncbi:putative sugar transporter protein [Daldinia childiae]|uniref:putative sugar transporter protein n=1 Tax=Daldinia childiae TaxID=326645 RepID=UPI0014474B7D|nr:putative sugar transporter protein [Daldinia childiae]KAF3058444.1 putative sugar transporter protein [Daldinia childiae]